MQPQLHVHVALYPQAPGSDSTDTADPAISPPLPLDTLP